METLAILTSFQFCGIYYSLISIILKDGRRDGFYIALCKNTFIKSEIEIDNNQRILRISVKSDIIWKGGKKVIIDGEVIDLKNFSNIFK